MSAGYLAIVGARHPGLADRLDRVVDIASDFTLSVRSEKLLILTSLDLRTRKIGGGAICGSIYRRDCSHLDDFRAVEQHAIIGSRGQALVKNYWGSYVAIWQDPDGSRYHVLRAPTGQLNCYMIEQEEVLLLTNDVDLLVRTNIMKPSINWSSVSGHLSFEHYRTPRTAITGVDELLGGVRLTRQHNQSNRTVLWSPWDFAGPAMAIQEPTEASRAVFETTQLCVSTMAAGHRKVLLGISGGLDSSIVAACLAQCGVPTTCFTLVTDDFSGDERRYARPLADHLQLTLIDLVENVNLVDLAYSDASRYPAPIARAFAQSGDRLQQRLAEEEKADAFFTGAGGDNVFAYIPSVSPVADRLLREGVGAMWATAGDISDLTGATLYSVLLAAVRRAWLRRPAYRWPKIQTYLTRDAIDLASGFVDHPWLVAPQGALPGKATHIAWILGIQNHLEGFERERDRPLEAPLMAQPLVELCLRIPTWLWCLDGRNRAIARRAFSHSLPKVVLERRSKGSPDGFLIAVFEANRKKIREMLLDGVLTQHGLLDHKALGAVLNRPILPAADYHRLMAFVDVEAWARSWMNKLPVSS